MFPQKPHHFLGIQSARDLAKVHDANRPSRQKPAFTEDLHAAVLIEGQAPTCLGHHY